MTTATVDTSNSRISKGSWLLVGTVARMYRATALLLFLTTLGVAVLLLHRYLGWADALALRERIGGQAYYFAPVHGAHASADSLSADGERIAFLPALYAALCTGVTTGREWQDRRVALTLSQSVSPRRWFTVRWSLLAALFTVLLLPLVVLYRLNVTRATHLGDTRLGLLSSGAQTQTIILTIGPATLAYVVLGVAAGALAGTVLRNTWSAAVAGPVLTWVLTALLVRSRAALLLDVPAYSKVSGMHPGGILGLQFYNLLPTDSYLLDSLSSADYWPYQLAESALVLVVAALLVLAAFRVLHRRTGQP